MNKIPVFVVDRIDETIPLVEAIWMMAADLDEETQKSAFRRVSEVILTRLCEIQVAYESGQRL